MSVECPSSPSAFVPLRFLSLLGRLRMLLHLCWLRDRVTSTFWSFLCLVSHLAVPSTAKIHVRSCSAVVLPPMSFLPALLMPVQVWSFPRIAASLPLSLTSSHVVVCAFHPTVRPRAPLGLSTAQLLGKTVLLLAPISSAPFYSFRASDGLPRGLPIALVGSRSEMAAQEAPKQLLSSPLPPL